MQNSSPINNLSKQYLESIVKDSRHIIDVLKKLNLVASGASYKILHKRLKELNINYDHFKKKAGSSSYKKNISLENLLKENSKIKNSRLKALLIKANLKEDKCEVCGQLPKWNGKPLTLQLDHINGINNDNRLENLRIICGHCHSQTETFCGRNKITKNISISVLKDVLENNSIEDSAKIFKIPKSSVISLIKFHNIDYVRKNSSPKVIAANYASRRFNPSKEELSEDIHKMPLTRVGEKYGVTDNSIRKRCKRLGINIPKYPKGYWFRSNSVIG